MATVHRHPAGLLAAADESQVHILPVQLGSADGVMCDVRPVKIVAVHRQPVHTGLAGKDNEVLVHVLPIQVSPADRLVISVRPVDVATVHSHAKGAVARDDEVLIYVSPI